MCVLLTLWSHQGLSSPSSCHACAPNACAKDASETEPVVRSPRFLSQKPQYRTGYFYCGLQPPVCIMRLKIWNVGKELVTWFQNSKFKRKRKSTEKTKDNFFFAWKDTSMSARIYQLCEAGEGAVRFLCFALFGIQMRPLSIVYMFILCLSTYCSPLT